MDSEAEIKLFTLNCWGLRFVSQNRSERMEDIGKYLADNDYDVVFLQVRMLINYRRCHGIFLIRNYGPETTI